MRSIRLHLAKMADGPAADDLGMDNRVRVEIIRQGITYVAQVQKSVWTTLETSDDATKNIIIDGILARASAPAFAPAPTKVPTSAKASAQTSSPATVPSSALASAPASAAVPSSALASAPASAAVPSSALASAPASAAVPSSALASASASAAVPSSALASAPALATAPSSALASAPASTDENSIWSVNNTKLFLSIRMSMETQFQSGRVRHDKLWGQIKEKLSEQGFVGKNEGQLQNKWNDLKKRYKKIRDQNRATGGERKTWEYLDTFDNFIGEKASTSPKTTFDTTVKVPLVSNATSQQKENQTAIKRKIENKNEPVSKKTVLEQVIQTTKSFKETVSQNHQEKMERFDRFLQIFERSLPDKNK